MRVIGAGFGRTGTLSLKQALERLGFGPCHHMMEVIDTPGQIHQWLALAKGRPVSFDDLLAGYESCVDWPAAAYWRELADHYPDAKVILTVRDPEAWLASMQATILKMRRRSPLTAVRDALLALTRSDLAAMVKMGRLTVDKRVFGGRINDPDRALRTFTEHIDEVKAAIAPERLLVFDVRQGWEPLCEFLAVPVPDEPFPRGNDAAAFAEHNRTKVAPLLRRHTRGAAGTR